MIVAGSIGACHFWSKSDRHFYGFSDNGRVPADGFVAAVHIAVQAAGACFRAPVPEVPVDSCR